MGASGFGPAPHINPNEFERRPTEGGGREAAPSTQLPHATRSSRATGRERAEPLDVRPSPQARLTHCDETSIADTEDSHALDVDDFRRWWRKRLPQEAAQNRSRRLRRMHLAATLGVIALISSVLAFKQGAPPVVKSPPVAANDTSKAHDVDGQTAGTSSDVNTIPQAGLSAATPNAPKLDAQVIEGLASKPSAQSTGPEPPRRETPIVSQASFEPERWSATDTPKPAAKPVGISRPRTGLPAKPPGKLTARVVVEGTEPAAFPADTPIPPLPIRTPANPERQANEAKSIQPVVESAVAPSTPEAAVKQPSNPLLSALAGC